MKSFLSYKKFQACTLPVFGYRFRETGPRPVSRSLSSQKGPGMNGYSHPQCPLVHYLSSPMEPWHEETGDYCRASKLMKLKLQKEGNFFYFGI